MENKIWAESSSLDRKTDMTAKVQSQTIQVEKIEVKPLFIAQRCPICNGFGTLKFGTLSCHGCDKKGYILIPAEKEGQHGK